MINLAQGQTQTQLIPSHSHTKIEVALQLLQLLLFFIFSLKLFTIHRYYLLLLIKLTNRQSWEVFQVFCDSPINNTFILWRKTKLSTSCFFNQIIWEYSACTLELLNTSLPKRHHWTEPSTGWDRRRSSQLSKQPTHNYARETENREKLQLSSVTAADEQGSWIGSAISCPYYCSFTNLGTPARAKREK